MPPIQPHSVSVAGSFALKGSYFTLVKTENGTLSQKIGFQTSFDTCRQTTVYNFGRNLRSFLNDRAEGVDEEDEDEYYFPDNIIMNPLLLSTSGRPRSRALTIIYKIFLPPKIIDSPNYYENQHVMQELTKQFRTDSDSINQNIETLAGLANVILGAFNFLIHGNTYYYPPENGISEIHLSHREYYKERQAAEQQVIKTSFSADECLYFKFKVSNAFLISTPLLHFILGIIRDIYNFHCFGYGLQDISPSLNVLEIEKAFLEKDIAVIKHLLFNIITAFSKFRMDRSNNTFSGEPIIRLKFLINEWAGIAPFLEDMSIYEDQVRLAVWPDHGVPSTSCKINLSKMKGDFLPMWVGARKGIPVYLRNWWESGGSGVFTPIYRDKYNLARTSKSV